jgi:hypothetical protein
MNDQKPRHADQDEILNIIDKIVYGGDPWKLSDEGVIALQKRMHAALEALFFFIGKLDKELDRQFALKTLQVLIMAFSETIDTVHNVKLAATKQALIARSAKSRKAAQRQGQLFVYIEAEARAQNRALSKGIKFAQLIRPGVRQRLGLEPEGSSWPSASTIKGAVAKLRSAPKGHNFKK